MLLAQVAIAVMSAPAPRASDAPPVFPPAQHGALSISGLDAVPTTDPWFGDDKFRHFFMSFATAAFAYGGARTVGMDRESAIPVSLAAAGVAGIGKEVYDQRRGERFSVRDLVWDAVGIGFAAVLLRASR